MGIRNGRRGFGRHALVCLLVVAALGGCSDQHFERPGGDLTPDSLKLALIPGFDRAPVLEKGTAPIYPLEAALNRDEGAATISFVIGADGHVHDLKLVSTSEKYFGDHLLIAAASWVFQPGLQHGLPADYPVPKLTWRYCAPGPGNLQCP